MSVDSGFGGRGRSRDDNAAMMLTVVVLISAVVYAIASPCSPGRCPATESCPPIAPVRY